MHHSKIQLKEAIFQSQQSSHFDLKPFAIPILGEEKLLKGLVCRPKGRPANYYYGTEYPKEKIVLHYTAGNLAGDLNQLTKDNYHVSVAFVIARDGTIYQLHHSKHWAYHLGKGALGGNETQSKKAIGIELSNYGFLKPVDGKLETYYSRLKLPDGRTNPVDIYCDESDREQFIQLEQPFRQQKYYASYAEEQYRQLILLLKYLTSTYNIPIEFFPKKDRYTYTQKVIDFKGIVSHVNYRKSGKWDIGPAFDWERVIHSLKLYKAQLNFTHAEKTFQILQAKIWDAGIGSAEDEAALKVAQTTLEKAYKNLLNAKRQIGRSDEEEVFPDFPIDTAYKTEDKIEQDYPYVHSRSISNHGEDGPEEIFYNPLDFGLD